MSSRRPVARNKNKTQLLPGKFTLLVFVVAVAGLYWLFPRDYYLNYFKHSTKASHTSLRYLKQLSARYKSNVFIQGKTIRQLIQLGKTNEAKARLELFAKEAKSPEAQEEIAWLRYIIARELFFRLTPDESNYQHDRETLIDDMQALLAYSDNKTEFELLIDDALAVNQGLLALKIYALLFKSYPNAKSALFSQAAKLALAQGQYQLSATYYFKAMSNTKSVEGKRQFFSKAIAAIESGGYPQKALQAASRHIQQVTPNRALQVYLTQVALRAGKPLIAEQYILEALTP